MLFQPLASFPVGLHVIVRNYVKYHVEKKHIRNYVEEHVRNYAKKDVLWSDGHPKKLVTHSFSNIVNLHVSSCKVEVREG